MRLGQLLRVSGRVVQLGRLVVQLVLGEQLVAAEAPDELSLDGGEVVEGWREKDVLVAGRRSDFVELRHVGSVDADSQDADA